MDASFACRPRTARTGENPRDWTHANDYSCAVLTILEKVRIGQRYLIGDDGEKNNEGVIELISPCSVSRPTPTSPPASPRRSSGTATTRAWWGPQKQATDARYLAQGR